MTTNAGINVTTIVGIDTATDVGLSMIRHGCFDMVQNPAKR